MSLKIEDVKAGDELVCIDIDGLADHRKDYMPQWLVDLMLNPVVVSKVNTDTNLVYFRNCSRYLEVSDFKYFEKKDQSKQYKFNDLIDAAVKAFKDVKIFSFGVTDCTVGIKLLDKKEKLFTLMDIQGGIAFIQLLYKETFVIECEDDLKRVNLNPKITLNNGEAIPFTFKASAKDHLIFYDQACGHNLIPFVFLKGATVEQDRGCNE